MVYASSTHFPGSQRRDCKLLKEIALSLPYSPDCEQQEKHGIKLSEAGLRWVQHHGVLTANDGVLLGPTSAAQLEETLKYWYDFCTSADISTSR